MTRAFDMNSYQYSNIFLAVVKCMGWCLIMGFTRETERCFLSDVSFNAFSPNVSFLYLVKTSKKTKGGVEIEHSTKLG